VKCCYVPETSEEGWSVSQI